MATKILQIVGNLGNEVYTQNDEPVDAKDGALWVDLDDEGVATDIKAVLAEAKASGEFKGDQGKNGADGFSPTITVETLTGNKGRNIVITDVNGTKTATILNGTAGADGANGKDGKSAYEIAKEKGYEGTESEWAALFQQALDEAHTHENGLVLDNFSEIDGKPAYNGEPIGQKPTIKSRFIPHDWSTGLITSTPRGDILFYVGEYDENGDPLFNFDETIIVDVGLHYDNAEFPSSKCCDIVSSTDSTVVPYTNLVVPTIYHHPTIDDTYYMYTAGKFVNFSGETNFPIINEIEWSPDKVPGFTIYYYNI